MKKNIRKPLLIGLSLVLVCVISVMGTIAYLTSTTGPVTNTFTAAGLVTDTFELKERPIKGNPGAYEFDGENYTADSINYTVIPGTTLPKDPKITITGLEVDAFLFLKVEDNTPATIEWNLQSGWTQMGTSNIYYRAVAAGNHNFNLIENNELTVAGTYTAPATSGSEQLVFTAYLVQSAGFSDASAAWSATFGSTPAQP